MKRNNKSILIIIVQLLIFTSYLHAAAPVISNITGTASSGQTLTISGSSMLQEDKTYWDTQFKTGTMYGFEGASYISDGYVAAPDNDRREPTYDTSVRLMGSKSYKGRITGATSANASCGAAVYPDNTSDVYVRMYSRWYTAGTNSKWPESGMKNLMTISSNGTDSIYVEPGPHTGNQLPTTMRKYIGGTDINYFTPYSWYTHNRWYCIEARFKVSSPKRVTVWVDGIQYIDDTTVSASNIAAILFNMINLRETGPDFDMTCWTDNFVTSSARIYPTCMVEVGNSPTYNAANVVKQALEYLSETSVQFKLNLTGLGSGPYYVWVTNNRQERSSAYQLGGSSGTPAPAANFSATPLNGTSPLTVSFTDTSTNSPTSWAWDFDNNGTTDSTVQNPSYQYSSAGTYSVKLTVTNAGGSNSITRANHITVSASAAQSPAPPSGTLFTENFENTSMSSRGWYDNTNIQLSTAQRVSGSTASAEYRFLQGATQPVSGAAMRKKISETDSVYVSYYIKHSSNWTGSNQSYHPHQFLLLTNKNGDWDGLAYTNLTVYIEENEGQPVIGIQDGSNIDETRIGQNLTNTTEYRSVAGCNGDSDGYGNGSCYSVATNLHWNWKEWRKPFLYFSDNAGPYYKGDWHFIEAYIKLNSISGGKAVKDGVIKYWYDGTLVMDYNNVVFRTAKHSDMKFNQFMIAPWIGDGSPVDQRFWIDNLTVATTRLGGVGGDTTPPNNPSGVNVQALP